MLFNFRFVDNISVINVNYHATSTRACAREKGNSFSKLWVISCGTTLSARSELRYRCVCVCKLWEVKERIRNYFLSFDLNFFSHDSLLFREENKTQSQNFSSLLELRFLDIKHTTRSLATQLRLDDMKLHRTLGSAIVKSLYQQENTRDNILCGGRLATRQHHENERGLISTLSVATPHPRLVFVWQCSFLLLLSLFCLCERYKHFSTWKWKWNEKGKNILSRDSFAYFLLLFTVNSLNLIFQFHLPSSSAPHQPLWHITKQPSHSLYIHGCLILMVEILILMNVSSLSFPNSFCCFHRY